MILRFHERCLGVAQKIRELTGPVPSESFRNVCRRRGARLTNLVAIFEIPRGGSGASKFKHLALHFVSKLPGNEILEAAHTHASPEGTRRASPASGTLSVNGMTSGTSTQ